VPSRAPGASCGRAVGIGLQALVDGVADLAFEGTQRLFGCLALGQFLVVAGSAVAVLVADLVIAAMWMAWFRRRFPRIDRR